MLQSIIGLGNPGKNYEQTRHNAGFSLLDALAERYGFAFREEKKFSAEYSEVQINGHKLHLLKPQLYMNRSGGSVAALQRFYKLPIQSLLVVHDELDLPEGSLRLKFSGGHGGHNGLRDIIAACGSKDFYRLRLGIGRPPIGVEVVDYVLGRPSVIAAQHMQEAQQRFLQELPLLLEQGPEKSMNRLNVKA